MMKAMKDLAETISNRLGLAHKAMLEWIFVIFFKKHTSVHFRKTPGGRRIVAEIRMFGWLVASEAIAELPGPTVTKVNR